MDIDILQVIIDLWDTFSGLALDNIPAALAVFFGAGVLKAVGLLDEGNPNHVRFVVLIGSALSAGGLGIESTEAALSAAVTGVVASLFHKVWEKWLQPFVDNSLGALRSKKSS